MSTALYRPTGTSTDAQGRTVEEFEADALTASAWGPIQHGGPVAALLGRSMDRCEPRPGTRLGRVTVEILGPIPIAPVRTWSWVERPGRRIELLQAVMEAKDPVVGWKRVALASAWRLRTQPTEEVVTHADPTIPTPPPREPGELKPLVLPNGWQPGGFVQALEWRFVHRGTDTQDPTVVWCRMTEHVLVQGEEITDLERLLCVADAANGIGARLNPSAFAFLNTELTVHLHTPPSGDWVGMVAESSVGPDGIGMSSAVLHSWDGPVGRINQSLLLDRIWGDTPPV